jgi:putative metalloenzyme radical SAM/SPASM domain maturase
MKHARGSGITEGDMTRETFLSLVPHLSQCEALILNGIGEPLLHPELENFIRIAKESMPAGSWVGFQSNGVLLDETRAVSLVDAGLDRICLSLDTICPDMFRTIREGGEIKDLSRAFGALGAARAKRPGSSLKVGVEFVIMRSNFRQLPDVLRWASAQGADFAIVTHLMAYDAGMLSEAVFDSNSDRAVELFHTWRRRAEGEGIDLSKYFLINFYKYFRTAEEQRVVDCVRDMVADARSHDLFLHVRNLFARDEALAAEVDHVLEEAMRAANEVGLDLKLPALSPKRDRRCDFVEGGSALVSWDGAVHPCYFLWHGFQCNFSYWRKYVPGLNSFWESSTALHYTFWSKHVRPMTFGSLDERNMIDIWNDPSFISFRKEVIGYEYPFCSNCNLVPCDYLTAEEFEQDCYSTTVPCGDCFWGLGIFNCLQ